MLRAWRHRSSLRKFDHRNQWLARIARNEAFRQRARIRPEPTPTIELQEGAEDSRVVAMPERADLRAALARLSECERRLIELRYEEDLTHPAIADRLGIPEGTVKVRLHRVRKKLRRAYAPQ